MRRPCYPFPGRGGASATIPGVNGPRPPTIVTCEMHTGGEPVRIIESGYPPLAGETILDKRRYAREKFDHLRTALLHEPRGHFDMYGVIPVEPDLPEADLAVLFIHNEGYSLMCGHAVLALGRYAVDKGMTEAVEPETRMVVQCPCGPVTVYAEVREGRTGRVRFHSVGAFAHRLGRTAQVPGFGPVSYDTAYGGAFYALAPAAAFGLDVRRSPVAELRAAAVALSGAVAGEGGLSHPDSEELAYLYGSILTDGIDDERPSANICVFADAQVDRSPTGSGVTARMALRYAKGQVRAGEERVFVSVAGSEMTGKVVSAAGGGSGVGGDHPVTTVEVAGKAHYTGAARFTMEDDDPFPRGFLLR